MIKVSPRSKFGFFASEAKNQISYALNTPQKISLRAQIGLCLLNTDKVEGMSIKCHFFNHFIIMFEIVMVENFATDNGTLIEFSLQEPKGKYPISDLNTDVTFQKFSLYDAVVPIQSSRRANLFEYIR